MSEDLFFDENGEVVEMVGDGVEDGDEEQDPSESFTEVRSGGHRSGGFMHHIRNEDWEDELDATGGSEVSGGDPYRHDNGRELHGTEHELDGVARTVDGSETSRDILTRSLGGKPWDPNRIMIFPNQERGKGPGKTVSTRIPTEWEIPAGQILAQCPEFDNQMSNFLRHCMIQGMLQFAHNGFIHCPALEARIMMQQEKVHLEQNEGAIKDANELLEAFKNKDDEIGFRSLAAELRNRAVDMPEPWGERLVMTVRVWEIRARWE